VTDDGLVVLASESGVLDLDPAKVVKRGRLQPGRMFLVDTEHGRIIGDEEIKSSLASQHPYDEWLHAGLLELEHLPEREHVLHTASSVARRQQTFGYTQEELRILLTPMAKSGGEALGSMGTDSPIAVLSSRPRLLFDYFTQLFAQVTNPPLDAIREELVTSLGSTIGPEGNALSVSPAHARQLVLPFPVIDNDQRPRSSTSTPTATCRGMRPASSAVSTRSTAAPRRCTPGSRRSSSRSPRRSAAAPASSCCPTATPAATSRRSRRCC
jgi:glutamate synthase (NADPH/NADH) large chain